MAASPSLDISSGSNNNLAIPPEKSDSRLVPISPKPGIYERAEVNSSTVANKIVIGNVKKRIIPWAISWLRWEAATCAFLTSS